FLTTGSPLPPRRPLGESAARFAAFIPRLLPGSVELLHWLKDKRRVLRLVWQHPLPRFPKPASITCLTRTQNACQTPAGIPLFAESRGNPIYRHQISAPRDGVEAGLGTMSDDTYIGHKE